MAKVQQTGQLDGENVGCGLKIESIHEVSTGQFG